MNKLFIVLAVIFVLLIVGYFGVSWYIAHVFATSAGLQFTEKSSVVSPNAKEFTVITSDNVSVSGWYFESTNNNSCAIILVPGFGQNRVNSSYGSVQIAKELLANGYNVAMFDPRGSGLSEKTRLGFGSTEGNDILGVLSFVNDQETASKNIGIIADSLGAITTLQFLPKLSGVGAIVVDSPAERIQPLVEKSLRERNIPSFLFPGIFIAAKYIFGADVFSVRPIDKVANSSRELLFLHGDKDTTISIQNSRNLSAASNPKNKLVVFSEAEHVQTYKTDPEKYRTEVFGFLFSQMPQCIQQ